MSETLFQTPLHGWHAAHGGKLVDFAGWSMPIQYESIVVEHQATRSAVGLFDVSHMGRFCFAGRGAMPLLEGILSRRVDIIGPGRVRYSLVTNEQGGVLDDVLVSHLTTEDESFYWLVVNASNRQKIFNWINSRVGNYDVRFTDETLQTGMIAVQGPRAMEIVDSLFADGKPSDLKYYSGAGGVINGIPVTVTRTGYTGEDGVEFVLPAESTLAIWERLVVAASAVGGRAAGLAARDTLRLEAGMPLYGHELTESINPYQAGLGFAIQLDNRYFPGCDALAELAKEPGRLRVGLRMEGKRVPREGYPILAGDIEVGYVSSGTFSPTLQVPIAMGFVDAEFSSVGTSLQIDLRGRLLPAHVVALPFYQHS